MTPHGSRSTYTNHGCRCEACKAAHKAATREYRARRRAERARGEFDPPHGTNSAYTNFGCRCDACRAASTATYRARRDAA